MNPDEGILPTFSVSDFVASLNQTFDYAYPSVVIRGELANLRVNRNRWVYFDLKDELATVKFFGTVYQLPGPLEDGMLLSVRGAPRLHPLYGFSVTVQNIRPTGEGTIRRAAELLQAKLAAEGLFDESRKRELPYPPETIGLITSKESAAYADFMKIINARWSGLKLQLIDVQVQGEAAPEQIVQAINTFNQMPKPPEVVVITRGGGSAEDLQAFSTESVTRAVAASRVPTLVAIGHEVDISLAELAADRRASTPSNAAEMLVPERQHVRLSLKARREQMQHRVQAVIDMERLELKQKQETLSQSVGTVLRRQQVLLAGHLKVLQVLNPAAILSRGYAIVRHNGHPVRSYRDVQKNDIVDIQLSDADLSATILDIKRQQGE